MSQVKRNGWPADSPGGSEHELTYLANEEMQKVLQETSETSASLGEISGEKPRFGQNDAARISAALDRLVGKAAHDGVSTLVVTHGDVLGTCWEKATGETVLEVEYCAWAVLEVAGESSTLQPAGASGINAMQVY